MTVQGSNIIPVFSVNYHPQYHVSYIYSLCPYVCSILSTPKVQPSATLKSLCASLSLFWNGKAIMSSLSVSLQLFDGIECEFPIFFIYMMIDGKPCSIRSRCYDASSRSLGRWKTDLKDVTGNHFAVLMFFRGLRNTFFKCVMCEICTWTEGNGQKIRIFSPCNVHLSIIKSPSCWFFLHWRL